MKKTYKSEKISCGNCKNMIQASLEDEFGPIEVDLTKTPREVTLEIPDEDTEKRFKEEMTDLGFDIIE